MSLLQLRIHRLYIFTGHRLCVECVTSPLRVSEVVHISDGHGLLLVSRSRPGCSMPEIWDIEDPQNVGKTPLCTHMSKNSRPHFTTVFSNDIYKVLKVPKVTKDLR